MFQESLPMSLWIVLPVWGCRTLGGKKRYKHTILGGSAMECVGSPSFPGAEPWVSGQQLYVQMLPKQRRTKRVLDSSPGREFLPLLGRSSFRSFSGCLLLTSMAFLLPHRYPSLRISLLSSCRPKVIFHQLSTHCPFYSAHHQTIPDPLSEISSII